MKQSNSCIILQQKELYSKTFLPSVMGHDNALQLFSGAILEIHRLSYSTAATFFSDEPAAVKRELEEKYLDIHCKRKRGKKVFLAHNFVLYKRQLTFLSFAEDILRRD